MDESTTAFASVVSKLIATDVAREVVRLLADRQKELSPAQEYMTQRQVAALTGYSVKAIERHRHVGTGPEFFRVGKSVRYKLSDVRAWIEQRREK